MVSAAPPALGLETTDNPALPGLGSRLAIRASGLLLMNGSSISAA